MVRTHRALLAAALMVCATANATGAGTPEAVTRRSGEPDVVSVPDEDPEMNAAIAHARETLPQFLGRLNTPPPGQTYIAVKARFNLPGGAEHIWLDDVEYRGGRFVGVLGNSPVGLRNFKAGDRVTVLLIDVSDWMAIDNGRLVGGFTIRVLRNRMSADERKAFDATLPFKFE